MIIPCVLMLEKAWVFLYKLFEMYNSLFFTVKHSPSLCAPSCIKTTRLFLYVKLIMFLVLEISPPLTSLAPLLGAV